MVRIGTSTRDWLRRFALVDAAVDLDRVRLHVGGPGTWYLRLTGHSAITFGDHIWYVSEAKRADLALLVHELVHVAQYRRAGKIRFLARYVRDLARARFRYSRTLPLEAPAYERQAEARRLLE